MKSASRQLLPCLQRFLTTAVIGMAVSSCAVGPDFRSPEAPRVTGYTAAALPGKTAAAPVTGGAAQAIKAGAAVSAEWWQLFQNPALDRLLRQAIAGNPTLASAQATLRQARENLRARSGTEYFPQVDASLSGSRQKASGVAFGQTNSNGFIYNLFNASVSVSYNLDLFGGGRRELEALQAQVDYQRFQQEAAYLALTANIVTTVIKEASVRAQVASTQEILALQEHQLHLVDRQFQLGGAARSDVLTQQSELAQFRATLPPLEKELAQTRNQLAVYVGIFPGESHLPEFTLEQLHLPQELPLSLPSSLTRQRPDIRAAEELLHAASAQVGVATANLYPTITLTGSLGSQAATLGNLLSNNTSVWGFGAGILQPLFRGGELTAQRRAAIAGYDQAVAQYRKIVLEAFQNVADVLQALEADAATLAAQAEAEKTSRDTLELTQRQYELGAVSYLLLLTAQRQHQQARISLVQAEAARYADTAALFQSLGGGWWNRARTNEYKVD